MLNQLPFVVVGDFNVTRYPSERRFCITDSTGMSDFNELIASCNLTEIPMNGKSFTWYGRNKKRSKLDRFFIEEELGSVFPNLVVKAMKKTLSDHIPLVLQWQSVNWGPKPFRFYNWWMNTTGYEELVKNALKGKVSTEAGKIWKKVDTIEEELDNLLMISEANDADESWNEVVFGEKTSALWKEYTMHLLQNCRSQEVNNTKVKWSRWGRGAHEELTHEAYSSGW
ncbi:hypothetical protein REPUB_Repub06bG0220500 [Reevesia pubescens]